MMPTEPHIDAYIAASPPFAQPILTHIRTLMHAASPDIGEAIKWGMPFFTYRGRNLANMAAFKGHAAFGFWHDKARTQNASDDAMGQFGKLTLLLDLPPDDSIAALIVTAMALIDAGDKPRARPLPAPKASPVIHPHFASALAAEPAASAVWSTFPPGKVRDYAEWINDAKTDPTRNKRIAQALEWIAQGKGRNWKYAKR